MNTFLKSLVSTAAEVAGTGMNRAEGVMSTLKDFITKGAETAGKAPTNIVQSTTRNAFNGMVEHEGEKIAVKDGIAVSKGMHYFVTPEGIISDGKSKLIGVVKDGKAAPMDTNTFTERVLGKDNKVSALDDLLKSVSSKGPELPATASPEEIIAHAKQKQVQASKAVRRLVQGSNDGSRDEFTSVGGGGHDQVKAQIENDLVFPPIHQRRR